jgi:molecular chaperone HtpG
MTRDEVVELIGTLAKSGTGELRQKLREANQGDAEELIGQFGIGFYSTFMVADAVELVTRKAGESSATRWESSGDGTYTLAPWRTRRGDVGEAAPEARGCQDALHDYTAPWKRPGLVRKYSGFSGPSGWRSRRPSPANPGASDSGDVTALEGVKKRALHRPSRSRPRRSIADRAVVSPGARSPTGVLTVLQAHAPDEPLGSSR